MENITRSLAANGTKLTVKGPHTLVAQEVTRLYAYGIISKIPETMAEGDFAVTCNTYRERFLAGMLSLASAEMSRSPLNHSVRYGKKAWNAIAIFRAAHMTREMFTVDRQAFRNGADVEDDGAEVTID